MIIYKDPERQRQAVREAVRRYRLRRGITRIKPDYSKFCNTQDVIPPGQLLDGSSMMPDDYDVDEALKHPGPILQSTNPMMVGYVPPVK